MTDRQIITIALCAFVAVGSVVIGFAAQPAEYPTITAAGRGGTSEHGRNHETSTTVPPAERDAISQSTPAVTSEGAKNSLRRSEADDHHSQQQQHKRHRRPAGADRSKCARVTRDRPAAGYCCASHHQATGHHRTTCDRTPHHQATRHHRTTCDRTPHHQATRHHRTTCDRTPHHQATRHHRTTCDRTPHHQATRHHRTTRHHPATGHHPARATAALLAARSADVYFLARNRPCAGSRSRPEKGASSE